MLVVYSCLACCASYMASSYVAITEPFSTLFAPLPWYSCSGPIGYVYEWNESVDADDVEFSLDHHRGAYDEASTAEQAIIQTKTSLGGE